MLLHRTLIWSIFALLPLLCGTWIIGLLLLAANEVNDTASQILAWFFTIINSLQVCTYIHICTHIMTFVCIRTYIYVCTCVHTYILYLHTCTC